MPDIHRIDPLGEQADPRCYVPLATDERALAALVSSLERRASPVLLVGASGIGKTILLRELARRAQRRGRRVLFSPFLHFPPEDVAGWLLHLLGGHVGSAASAEEALLRAVRAPRARMLDVLVDEIQRSPPDSARLLNRVARAGWPRLAVLVAGTRGPRLDALLPALQPETTVALPDALPDPEIAALCDAVLRHPGVSAELRTLATREHDTILGRARGLPVLLKAELALRAHDLAVGRPRREPESVAAPPPAKIVREPETPPPAAPEPPALAPTRARPDLARALATGQARLALSARAAAAETARRARRARDVASAGLARGARTAVDGSARFVRRAHERADVASERWGRVAATWRATVARRAREEAAWSARLGHRLREHGSMASARWGRALAAIVERLAARADAAARATIRALPRIRADATTFGVRTWQGCRALAVTLRAHAPRARTALAAALLLALPPLSLPHGLRPVETRPAAVSAAPPPAAAPAATLVRVHVNARPWAHIRVDGVDVGPTPLGHLELTPGPHDFEATFPNGRTLRRRVEIDPEQRFVTLP